MVYNVQSPRYADLSGKMIHCMCEIEGYPGTHPHMAVDGDAPTQALYNALRAGIYGPIAEYTPPVVDVSQLANRAVGEGIQIVNRLIAQLIPDDAYRAAVSIAAVAPADGPVDDALEYLALAQGMSVTQFRKLAVATQLAVVRLSAAAMMLRGTAISSRNEEALCRELLKFNEGVQFALSSVNPLLPDALRAETLVVSGVD